MTQNIQLDIHPDSVDNIKTDLQHQVMIKCLACVAIFNQRYPDKPYLRPINIDFKLRGQCAGKAWANRGLVQFNNYLLENNPEDMLNDTVPHEMAHILADNLFRRTNGHNASWARMCKVLGLQNPEKYHSYTTVRGRAGGSNITYICDLAACSTPIHKVSAAKHKRIQSGDQYRCTTCGTIIVRRKPATSKLAEMARNS